MSEVDEYEGLFDPAQAPELRGNVAGGIAPTDAQKAEAVRKLAERGERYAWKAIPVDRLERLRGQLTHKAAQAQEEITNELRFDSHSWKFLRSTPGDKYLPEKTAALVSEAREKILSEYAANLAEKAQNDGVACYAKPLPFYNKAELFHIAPGQDDPALRFVVWAPNDSALSALNSSAVDETIVTWMDGTSRPIHDLNRTLAEKGALNISAETVEEYIDFFCMHVHGEGGAFAIIEHDKPVEGDGATLVPAAYDMRTGAIKAQVAQPLTRIDPATIGGETVEPVLGTVLYANKIFRSLFLVRPNGMIEMTEDTEASKVSLKVLTEPWAGPVPPNAHAFANGDAVVDEEGDLHDGGCDDTEEDASEEYDR